MRYPNPRRSPVREPVVMRSWRSVALLLAMAAVTAAARQPACTALLWTTDLRAQYKFPPFLLNKHNPPWKTQEGVTFTSPNTLVVYEVVENDVPHLERRTASGGGGRFTLRAVFLDARNGRAMREMSWPTTPEDPSNVRATNGGRFLVQTGLTLQSYSPEFGNVASFVLPGYTKNSCFLWGTTVVPPGKPVFAYKPGCNDRTDTRILMDADTLKPVPNPSPADLALWPGASSWFPKVVPPPPITPINPANLDALDKLLDQSENPDKYCAYEVFLGVAYHTTGICKKIDVHTRDGSPWWRLKFRDHVGAIENNGDTLAVEVEHWPWAPFSTGIPSGKSLRIALYDLAQKTQKCSVDLRKVPSKETYDFAVSANGLLAVRVGNQLNVYKP